MKIPAISGGGATNQFKKVFWLSVTEKDATTGLPQRGSIGVHWNVYRDLRGLAATNLMEQLLLCRINKISPRNPVLSDPLISKISAGFLKTFYEFCEQTEQPFFFIKNGAMPLYLVRKTSNYLYDPDHEFPHRIAYEFVRVVTESEGRQRLGDGNKAMFMMELETPVDTPADVSTNTLVEASPNLETMPETVPEVMATKEKPKRAPKKKAATATTVATTTEAKAVTVATVKQERKPKSTKKTVKTTAATAVTTKTTIATATTAKATIATAVPSHLHPTHLETADEPLSVDSVELIKLQTFDASGTPVYRDPLKNKLYKQHTNGSIGPYIGRWSSKEERIYEDIPDSDREDE